MSEIIFKNNYALSDIHSLVSKINYAIKKDNLDYKKDNIIIFLDGNLASGKTTLVKSFAKLHNILEVSSPTFGVLNNYNNEIYHYDLYICEIDKFISMGLLEELNHNGIHFIEWGDDKLKQILKDYGFNYYELSINFINDNNKQNNEQREYIFGK